MPPISALSAASVNQPVLVRRWDTHDRRQRLNVDRKLTYRGEPFRAQLREQFPDRDLFQVEIFAIDDEGADPRLGQPIFERNPESRHLRALQLSRIAEACLSGPKIRPVSTTKTGPRRARTDSC